MGMRERGVFNRESTEHVQNYAFKTPSSIVVTQLSKECWMLRIYSLATSLFAFGC